MRNNSKGQGVLEALVAIPVLLLLLLIVAQISYRMLVFNLADHLLYEACICSEHTPIYECKNKFNASFGKLNFLKKKYEFQLSSLGKNKTASLIFYLSPAMYLNKKVHLP